MQFSKKYMRNGVRPTTGTLWMISSKNSKTSLSLIGLNTIYPKRHIVKSMSSTHNYGQPDGGAEGSTLAEMRGSIHAEGSIIAGACSAFSLESSCNCKCICLSSLHIFTYAHSLFVGNISSSMISIIFRTCSIPKSSLEIIIPINTNVTYSHQVD